MEDKSLSKITCMDVHIDLHLQEDDMFNMLFQCAGSPHFSSSRAKEEKKGS